MAFIGLFFASEDVLWKGVEGLRTSNRTLYITDEHSLSQVKTELPETEEVVEVMPSNEFFLRESVVRARPVVDALTRWVGAENTGPVTVFLEMSWAVRTPSGDIYLRELQEAFQTLLAQTPGLTLICLYNEALLLEEQLLLGLVSHPLLCTSGGIRPNPYYLPPAIIRRNNVKQRFDYWLATLDPSRSVPSLPVELNTETKTYAVEKPFGRMVAQTDEGRWKIRCFGELRIRRENGDLIDWNTGAGSTRKLKTLFAFLLLRGEKGATAPELADLLWPDADTQQQAINRLYHAVRYLRVVLDGSSENTRQSSFVRQQNAMYFLRLPYDSWVDLPMFQELCYKGNAHLMAGNLEPCKVCYESAERLYTGDLFGDIPAKYIDNTHDDWCWSKRTWFRDMYHKLLYGLARVHRQLGNPQQALAYADRALDENPVLEEAHKEKLLALADLNRPDALNRAYRIYGESLRKFDLGTPSPTIRQLYLDLSKK
jgi:two-component SAPR family response regulator